MLASPPASSTVILLWYRKLNPKPSDAIDKPNAASGNRAASHQKPGHRKPSQRQGATCLTSDGRPATFGAPSRRGAEIIPAVETAVARPALRPARFENARPRAEAND